MGRPGVEPDDVPDAVEWLEGWTSTSPLRRR